LEGLGFADEDTEFDPEVIEAGTDQTERIKDSDDLKDLIAELEEEYSEGAPVSVVIEYCEEAGIEPSKTDYQIDKLKQKGEVYEPQTDHLRTT
jgi:replicative DNA helicase Mcm